MAQCISGRGGSVRQKSAEALKKRCKNKRDSTVVFDSCLFRYLNNLATPLSQSYKVICDTAVAYLLPLFRNLISETNIALRRNLRKPRDTTVAKSKVTAVLLLIFSLSRNLHNLVPPLEQGLSTIDKPLKIHNTQKEIAKVANVSSEGTAHDIC